MKNSPFSLLIPLIYRKAALACAVVTFVGSASGQSAPGSGANAYDLLSRTLMPIAALFSPQSTQHGLNATFSLEAMTGLPPEMVGSSVELALQPPDRVLVRGPYGGETVTICRVGQETWLSPGSQFQILAALTGSSLDAVDVPDKKRKEESSLAPMVLPFPPQQLALLPVLFQVNDQGEHDGLRVMDIKLMPQLAKKLHATEWGTRLSIDSTGKPVRIEVARPGWHIVLRVDRLDYSPSLPDSTWEPLPGVDGKSPDVIHLTASQTIHWVDILFRRINAHQNKETH